MRKIIFVLAFVVVWASGCRSVPKDSSLVGEVDKAIVVIQEENDKLIKALGDVQRNILDEKFEQIYANIESKYRQKYNIPEDALLTAQQNLDVTANVIVARDHILYEIAQKEQQLYEQSHTNFNKLRTINKAVKQYLDSLQSLNEAQYEATKKLEEIIGIDLDVDNLPSNLENL